jgi:DNA-3-methyladenine glycosylase I
MLFMNRCPWAKGDPLYIAYHDQEWGVPVYNDSHLFEMLILEGMQAGLSWLIVLRKRENFREAFEQFNAEKMARYTDKKISKLLTNSGIIRNQKKIQAAIQNAKAFLSIREQQGEFARYIWQFVDGVPKQNIWKTTNDVPATSKESDLMSKDLKKQGFLFVGTTICYAYMQAVGMVNDHLVACYRYREIAGAQKK